MKVLSTQCGDGVLVHDAPAAVLIYLREGDFHLAC